MNNFSKEIRVMNCVAELIESSLSNVVCCFGKENEGLVSAVWPKGMIEKNYFFILFLELFSSVNAEMVPGSNKDNNLLTLLRKISEKPCLNTMRNDVNRLHRRASEFLDWLDRRFDYCIYSQEIGKHVTINISRREAFYLVGNRCKHTLVRSNNVLKKLVKKYREAGINLLNDEEAFVLEDIDHWFIEDFCAYHFTKLCELESNLYHSIIEYMRPIHMKAVRFKKGMPIRYEIPNKLERSDIRSEYCNLMNKVNKTRIPFIKTPEILEGQY